ncbi:MAG: hypothetical protein ACHQJ6_01285 [Candidatus Berkiellales bacterium]
MYQQYLKKILLFLLLFSFPLCGNWLFLLNCGELLPIEDIVEKQLSSNQYLVVGLATRNQGYYYKKAMVTQLKPEILVLGSSRVMQFRSEFFNKTMVNAGGAMSSINEGYSFIKESFQTALPKVVILGLDYWWFNQNATPPLREVKPPHLLSHKIALQNYLLPFKWLATQKIPFSFYLKQLNPFKEKFRDGIGVDGILNKNGFGPDGSHVYTKVINGKEKSDDEKFVSSLNYIEHHGPHFEWGDKINDVHFQQFLEMIQFLQTRNIKIILFIPPLAPSVVTKMHQFSQEYAFIDDLKKRLQQTGLPFYDFHDAMISGITDCEFVDGTHGGEIAYAKILTAIAQKDNQIQSLLNRRYLASVIRTYQNHAMVPKSNLNSLPEVDFLHIGCEKLALRN